MATALTKTKLTKTKHPGVYRRNDGSYQIRAAFRHGKKVTSRKKVLPPSASLAEVLTALADLKEAVKLQVTRGHLPQTTNPGDRAETVESYAERWLEVKKKRLKESTYVSYEAAILNRILPRIGFVRCVDVRRGMCEAWVAWAEEQVKTDGSPYSEGALRTWWRPMAQMLRDLSADYDLSDPTRRIRPPEAPEVALVREQGTLSIKQVQTLLTDAQKIAPKRYAEIVTLATTGVRAGELFALKWDAINFERGEILIRRSISMGKLTETTKTKAWRTVPMAPLLADVLRVHRRAQVARHGLGWAADLVFPSYRGTPRSTGSLKKTFVALGVHHDYGQSTGPQVLRRTFNTLLLAAQVDQITIRAMMGHTSAAMTQRYAGVRMDEKRAAVLNLFG